MDDKINVIKNLGNYFQFNQWLEDNEKEIKLRLFMIGQKNRTKQQTLQKIFPRLQHESDRNYNIFIEYMTQGFSRKRTHLEEKYTKNIIRNVSHKYKWTERAKKWEENEIKLFLQEFHLTGTEGLEQQNNETNLRYFLFLCYYYMGEQYSLGFLTNLFQEYNIHLSDKTLAQFSYDRSWRDRRNEIKHKQTNK